MGEKRFEEKSTTNKTKNEVDEDSYYNIDNPLPMNEVEFIKNQNKMPGFISSTKSEIEAIKGKFVLEGNKTQSFSLKELIIWWHIKLIGCYGIEQNSQEVEEELNLLYVKYKKALLSNNWKQNYKDMIIYQEYYASVCLTFGTLYALRHEYVKSVYYYFIGMDNYFNCENESYFDFIHFICNKVKKMPAEYSSYSGIGFNENEPCGSMYKGKNAIYVDRNVMMVLPQLKSTNGDILFLKNGVHGIYGCINRIGSTWSEVYGKMIDIYETFIIDDKFNLKKIKFYWNGYFSLIDDWGIKLPKGFKIGEEREFLDKNRDKNYSQFVENFNFIETK